LPESGYSTTSGLSFVLIDRNLSGASEVLTIWCGYAGPGGMNTVSPAFSGSISPATRKVPWPSRMTKASSCA
jgi:hypothetical protein